MIKRSLMMLGWFAATAAAAFAATDDARTTCRPEYVAPYTEQCEFAFKNLKQGSSPKDLSLAFETCARAQDADLPCVQSSDRSTHVVSLGALYRAATAQADIALYARQFRVAEALLREKLNVIDIAAREARPGDTAPATERAATLRAIAESQAGECTQRALASAGRQYALAKAHRYGDLSQLLDKKHDDYESCARLVRVPSDRAYVRYVGLVALEESGRAAQAAGHKDAADRTYKRCIDDARADVRDASDRVKTYLATVQRLCAGRMDGTYAVDRPEPLDAQGGTSFKPLTLPKS